MLRYFNLWLLIGWLLIFTVCYLSLMPSPPDFDIKFEQLDKLEHMLAYFILMGWFTQLYQTKSGRKLCALLFIMLGITIEILQGLGQVRFFEYADMLANTLGVLLAWVLTRGQLKSLLFVFEKKVLL